MTQHGSAARIPSRGGFDECPGGRAQRILDARDANLLQLLRLKAQAVG